jgi:hypothetical protein
MTGEVRHRRFWPKEHEFRYPLFMVLLDVDHIEELLSVSRWTGYERFGLASFHARDYLALAPGALPGGRVLLLTHLRYLGYGFNPISLFYCEDRIGAEVHSTFGERHVYWLNDAQRDARGFYHAEKKLHVSPFNRMTNEYRFGLAEDRKQLTVHIENFEDGRRFFDATLTLRWQPWTAANLERALWRYPLMTARVTAAIHWEALKLYLKRVPFVPHPEKSRRTFG